MVGTGETMLDESLVAYVDSFDTQAIQGVTEADMIDFCSTYGPEEAEDRLLERLDAGLSSITEDYVTEVEKFLSISPDYGMLSFATRRNAFSYVPPPLHQSYGRELEGWLKVAKKHLPGAEDEAMDEIVACITDPDLFDPLNFERAVRELSPDLEPGKESPEEKFARDALEQCGQNLAKTTTEQLCDYATNPGTVQRFVDSSFMRAFGDEAQKTMLYLRILALKGEYLRPDQYALAASTIDTDSPRDLARHLGRVFQYGPEIAARIVAEHPHKPLRLLSVGRTALELIQPEYRTKTYSSVGTEIEKQVSDNLRHYGQFIEWHFQETGTFEPEHIHRLKELVEAAEVAKPATFEAMDVLDVVCANLPIGELNEFADAYPDLVRSFRAAPVCVRRFAANGQTERAFALARNADRIGGYWDVLEVAHKLLSIYDETGDESAYDEAEQLVEGIKDERINGKEIHQVLVHIFAAARRHGHAERAEQARLGMEPYYASADSKTRNECLEQRVHVALDDGDLQDAEHFAALLYASNTYISGIGTTKGEHEMYRSATLLYVLRAYMKVNDVTSATNLVKTYFATEKPYPVLRQAMAILKNEPCDPLPSLFGKRINAIAKVMDPRGGL